jgi:TPR repeat protein
MKKDPRLLQLHAHASNNEIEILHSTNCSCFFCRQSYSARSVNDWVNDTRGVTALCPECGMDAVIGDACGLPLDKTTLKEMNLAFYGEDYMEKHPAAAKKYVKRYEEGKITHKAANEALYIQYLYSLASGGDSDSAFSLGQLYENGTEFTKADPKAAFSYYAMQCLSKDGEALSRLGVLCENGSMGKIDQRGAFECYCKAMAMGSMEGLIHYCDCYLNGVFVVPNPEFAFDVLSSIWTESYRRFVLTNGKDINIFPDSSYRLGKMFHQGLGTKKDDVMALRFFLFAQFGYNLLSSSGLLKGALEKEALDADALVDKLSTLYKLKKQDPVFDNDTFADSLEAEADETVLPLGSCTFAPGAFDKSQNTFSFDVTYPYPPLIVDCGNLFCGFVPGTIHWSFTDVSDVTFGLAKEFDHVNGNPEDGWQLLSGFGDDSNFAASIVFVRTPKKPVVKEKPTKGKAKA